MNQLKLIATIASVSLLSFSAQGSVSKGTLWTLPLDRPTSVNNVGLECMGVGSHDREHAIAKKYSVRLETVGGYGQYLANGDITLRDRRGRNLMDVKCYAPWLMIKLDPGRYSASIKVPGAAPQDVSFAVPERGLHSVYVRFPGKMAGQERSIGPANEGTANETHKQT